MFPFPWSRYPEVSTRVAHFEEVWSVSTGQSRKICSVDLCPLHAHPQMSVCTLANSRTGPREHIHIPCTQTKKRKRRSWKPARILQAGLAKAAGEGGRA